MDRCIHDLFLHIYILQSLICIYVYIYTYIYIYTSVYLRPGTFEASTREVRTQPAKNYLEISRSTLLWKWKIPTAQIQRLGFSKKSSQMNQVLGSMSPQNHEE